jgi:hypothetical protein
MRRSGLISLAVACCITVIGGETAAEENSNQKSPDWAQNYGLHNKECLEWTDTCVHCVRFGSRGDYSCSNIGIACQPKKVECLRRSGEKAQ